MGKRFADILKIRKKEKNPQESRNKFAQKNGAEQELKIKKNRIKFDRIYRIRQNSELHYWKKMKREITEHKDTDNYPFKNNKYYLLTYKASSSSLTLFPTPSIRAASTDKAGKA